MMRGPIRGTPWAVGLAALLLLACNNGPDPGPEADPLQIPSPSLTIGGVDAPEEAAFFLIRKVEVDRRGGVLILDPSTTHVAWFHPDGRFIRNIGRSGSGPGEFREPWAMALDDRNRLHVYDQRRREIVIYALYDTVAVHVEDQRVESRVEDMCVAGERRFAATLRDSTSIDEIDERGRVIRSFGSPEGPDPASVADPRAIRSFRGFYNTVVMACDVQSASIVLLYEKIPIVRAYTLDGELRWRTVLSDFTELEIFLTGTGVGSRTRDGAGTYHIGTTISFAPGNRIVATLSERTTGKLEGRDHARILDLNTGTELSRLSSVARLTLQRNGRFYAFEQFPAPKVMRFESWPIHPF